MTARFVCNFAPGKIVSSYERKQKIHDVGWNSVVCAVRGLLRGAY